MTTPRKLVLAGVAIVVLVIGVILYPRIRFSYYVGRSFDRQDMQLDAVKPLFDATVTRQIKVGDTLGNAEQVLDYAGLSYHISREQSSRVVRSLYHVGDGAGFSIRLVVDSNDIIAKVEIRKSYTGP